MNLNINKKAFSLTELLIVLVIVAVLFSALLPIMTKRSSGATTANEPVWSFVSNDDQKDAFFDSGAQALTTTAYIGLKPEDLTNNVKPYSKVVLKAKKGQDFIQFRYGSGNGSLTGLFAMDDKANTMLTGRLSGAQSNNYNYILGNYSNNTVAGIGAYKNLTGTSNNTAIGASSISGVSGTTAGTDNVAVGSSSVQYGGASNSVFLGANTGKSNNGRSSLSTVGVGTNVLSLEAANSEENTFAGYYVGAAGFNNATKATRNTVIGAPEYFGQSAPKNNTIIGYGAYRGGNNRAVNMTILGYGACDSVSGADNNNTGSRTCIGYSTAIGSGATPTSFNTDNYDHIFLGGNSPNAYSGRSPLEIHNIGNYPSLNALPKMGPTVVLNSHLVVRGNIYFPRVTDGKLVAHSQTAIPALSDKSEQNRDYCSRGCHIRRKFYKFREKNGCPFLADLFKFIFNYLVGGLIWALEGVLTNWWSPGNWIVNQFKPSSDYRTRGKDAITTSAMLFSQSSDGDGTLCTFSSGNRCPVLKTSDIRLKENISENTDSIEKIMLVLPYNYTYKNDEHKVPQVGVIAQDLEKYSPNSVTEDKYGYKTIRWDEMFYVTINSIKDLSKDIENITASVDLIENDAKTVAKDQKSIEKRIDKINKRIDKLEK